MKKAQMQEFIGIVLLILALVMFVMFDRVSSTDSALSRAESIAEGRGRGNIWAGANIMLYSTLEGVMLINLLGDHVCKNVTEVTYGRNRNINISNFLMTVLTAYYGEGHWSFELRSVNGTKCYNPGLFHRSCAFPDELDYRAYDITHPMPCTRSFGEGTLYVY
ncbi:MAG: hypothetical protein ABIC95_06345 [archaeon]